MVTRAEKGFHQSQTEPINRFWLRRTPLSRPPRASPWARVVIRLPRPNRNSQVPGLSECSRKSKATPRKTNPSSMTMEGR